MRRMRNLGNQVHNDIEITRADDLLILTDALATLGHPRYRRRRWRWDGRVASSARTTQGVSVLGGDKALIPMSHVSGCPLPINVLSCIVTYCHVFKFFLARRVSARS